MYATNIPFPVPANHTLVEMWAPSPDLPSHFVGLANRYYQNYNGRIFVDTTDVDTMLQEGCTLSAPPVVQVPEPPAPPIVSYDAPTPAYDAPVAGPGFGD